MESLNISPQANELNTSFLGQPHPKRLPRPEKPAWIKLNRLRTGVGRFHLPMHKWGLAPSPNCECNASEQTADHVLTACPIHRASHGARGLMTNKFWMTKLDAGLITPLKPASSFVIQNRQTSCSMWCRCSTPTYHLPILVSRQLNFAN